MQKELINTTCPSYDSLGDNVMEEKKENQENVKVYKIGCNTYEVRRSYCKDGKDIIEMLYEQYLSKKSVTI